MFKRVLIANRGEIAIRIARAAASLGVDSVAIFTRADAMSLHTKLAGSAREIGGDAVRGYLDIEAVIAAAKASGSDCVHPGYGFLSENTALRRALQGGRTALHRSFARKPETVRRQGRGPRLRPGAGHSGHSRRAQARLERRGQGEGQGDRLSGDAESLGRRRRARHACRDQARGDGRGLRALPGRGRGRVRRSRPLPGEDRAAAAAHRGPGAGRRPGQCRAPVRARLLGAAAQPEGRRGGAGAQSRRGPAPAHPGRRREARARGALRECRHGRVPGQPRDRRALLHRVQSAHPGRAHHHRAGHGLRPGRGPVPHRCRRVARRARASPTRRRSARRAALPCRRASWRRAPARSAPTANRPARACASMPAAMSGWRRRRSSIPCSPS